LRLGLHGGNSIVNLNGGTLGFAATDVVGGGQTFNYNGGTLVLNSTGSANFMNALTRKPSKSARRRQYQRQE